MQVFVTSHPMYYLLPFVQMLARSAMFTVL